MSVTNEVRRSLSPQMMAQMIMSEASYESFLKELIRKMHWGCGIASDRAVEVPLIYRGSRWLLDSPEDSQDLGRLSISSGRQHRIQLFLGSPEEQVNVFEVVWAHDEIDDMFEKKWEETFISFELWDGLREAAITEPHNQTKEE